MNNLSFLTNKIINVIENFDVKSQKSREEYNELIGCLFRIVIAERGINRSSLLLKKSFTLGRWPESVDYMQWLFGNLYTLPLKELTHTFENLTLSKSLYEVVFDRTIYSDTFSMKNENLWFQWQFKGRNLSDLYKELL